MPLAIGDDLEEAGIGFGEWFAEVELGHRVAGGPEAEGDGDGLAGRIVGRWADEEWIGALGQEADAIGSGAGLGQR